jgi:ribosomal protein S18 acetylase RimI-like enzyme
MNIEDFFPKYPNIEKSEYPDLNAYEGSFNNVIFHKKEFYENRLDKKAEDIPNERGVLLKHQLTIARYLSSNTPYDRLLIVHSMGSGKTCSVIGAIEQIKVETPIFTGAIILAKGYTVLSNFITELVERCTPGQYIPEDYAKLTKLEKIHRVNKSTKFYTTETFAIFGKHLKKMNNTDMINTYSNKIIVVDEVHNLRIQKDEETRDTYKQFYRLFHLVKNCKIIFLSGTPMKDSPEEIASVINLIIPEDQKIATGEKFKKEFMQVVDGDVYTLIPEKGEELKKKLVGKISFLRLESTVPKIFLGDKNVGKLKHLIVQPVKMSTFQTNVYRLASEKKQELDLDRREASLFVFPDGSYGKEGFKKYVEIRKNKGIGADTSTIISSFKFKTNIDGSLLSLKGESPQETIKNIRKYSTTYATVLQKILDTNGNCFIYCSIVKGGGCILLSLLLELVGLTKAKGGERDESPRYAILTSETSSDTDIKNIRERYNRPDNFQGKFIKVIIGSRTVSESFSLKNVIFEAIVAPWWNYSETEQAIARGIRIGSHKDLQNPVIEIMQPVAIPKDESIQSVDMYMYEKSEDKDIAIRSIMRMLMEVAFDCSLNYLRNHVKGKSGSRECDYTSCNYNCFGVDMKDVENGLAPEDLEYLTYQLYYSNPKTPIILKKIEQIFRENYKTNFKSIVKNLKEQGFKDEEINNSLLLLQEHTTGEKDFNYNDFLDIYSRTPVKKIINKLEKLFNHNFRMDLDTINLEFSEYTEFELLTALQTIINESIVITNKYGFNSYLREEKNSFFLVNSLSVKSDFYTGYYNQFPHTTSLDNYQKVLDTTYSKSIPELIGKICSCTDIKEFSSLVKTLPVDVQELFIESAIDAKYKDKESPLVAIVLEFFKSYIKNTGKKTWISTFLDKKSQRNIRCYRKGIWKDCDEKEQGLLQEQEVQRQQKLRNENPYGVMGKFNPETGKFCLVDFRKEKESLSASKSDKKDKRLTVSGQVCSTWKIEPLIRLGAQTLKIPAPKGYRASSTRKEMFERINRTDRYNLSEIFTPQELESSTDEDLRRILYWGTPTSEKEGGIRGGIPMCKVLQDWFKKNNILEVDNQCGVRGKKGDTVKVETNTDEQKFRIETYVPNEQEDQFKTYFKDIRRLMGECFDIQKYTPDINDNLWILIFSRKLVGFLTIDSKNVIWNVCIAKNYRRNKIATNAISYAMQYICKNRSGSPVLIVDNFSKDYKKLVRMYESFGFKIQQKDEKETHMIHNCPI